MRQTITSLLGAAAAMLLMPVMAAGHDLVPGPPQERPVLLKGGDLYTVSDGVLTSTDLLFAAGEIQAIGKDLAPPADAEVIDVSGKRVYPGLIAPLSGLGLVEIGAVRATRDLAEVGDVTPEVLAHVAFNPDSELIPTVRAHGITTAQISPQGGLVQGRSFLAHLDGWTKEDAAIELVDGLHISWPQAAVIHAWWMDASPEEQREQMEESRAELREAFDQARTYLAAHQADPEQAVDLRWEAMAPALRGELPVYIQADDYRQIIEAVAFAEEYGLRMVLVGGRDSYQALELLKEHGIPVIVGPPTDLPMRQDEDYDIGFKLPRLLHEAEIDFCLSQPGSWDGRNLPFQAGRAVAYGLPADVALTSITLSTAQILGIADRQGSLEVGKEATLFVSTGDVMDMLGQEVTEMFIAGRHIDLDNRHKRLFRKYDQKPAVAASP